MRGVRRHGYCPGDRSLFKGGSSHSHPQAPRAKSPPTCSRVPTLRHKGRVPHVMRADPKQKKPNRCTRSSILPKPAGERADRYARGVQPHHGCAPFRLHRIRWDSVKAQARMSCNRCDGYSVQRNRTATCANVASSRLRNQCRDSRQPCA
jgi:hypothetical protein